VRAQDDRPVTSHGGGESLHSLEEQLAILRNLPPDFLEEIQSALAAVDTILHQLMSKEDDISSCFNLELDSIRPNGDRHEKTDSLDDRVFKCLLEGLDSVTAPAAVEGILRSITSYRSLVAGCLNRILFDSSLSDNIRLQLFSALNKKNIVLARSREEQPMSLANFILSAKHCVASAQWAERLAALLIQLSRQNQEAVQFSRQNSEAFQFSRQNSEAAWPAAWTHLDGWLKLRQAVKTADHSCPVRINPLGKDEASFLLAIELAISEASF
jgi:hypothetical protein